METTTTAPTATTLPEPSEEAADFGFLDADFDDPPTAAAFSVRAGSAFLMLSDVFIDCLRAASEADPTASLLVTEMSIVERGTGLSEPAADLAAGCMAKPGYVDDVRDSWIGTETDSAVAKCLADLFDVEIDVVATSASLQIEATEADIGGVTMDQALSCSSNDLLPQILRDSGLEDITGEESQCIGRALADAQASGAPSFRTSDFVQCLSDASHNTLAQTQFGLEVFGGEGKCLNEVAAARGGDSSSPVVPIETVLKAHSTCGTLGRLVNRQNGGRLGTDELACINDSAKANPPVSNPELNDLVQACL